MAVVIRRYRLQTPFYGPGQAAWHCRVRKPPDARLDCKQAASPERMRHTASSEAVIQPHKGACTMAGINKVILVGNLGADPEIRYTPGGTAVANFRIATSETRVNKEGLKETKTEWHRIVAFGKLAEICGEYLAKGRQVYIEGKIQTRSWDDRDGNKKYTTEILANVMQMLGGPKESASAATNEGQGVDETPPDMDDIPF